MTLDSSCLDYSYTKPIITTSTSQICEWCLGKLGRWHWSGNYKTWILCKYCNPKAT